MPTLMFLAMKEETRLQKQEMLVAGVWVHDQRVQVVRQKPKEGILQSRCGVR